MKITLLLLLSVFSLSTFANCADDYNIGLNEYGFATRHFDKGSASYQAAVDNAGSNNPNMAIICKHLVDSVSGFYVANESYGNCAKAFGAATSSCSGSDSTSAANNKKICNGNKTIANDNEKVVRNSLKNSCFSGSEFLDFAPLENIQNTIY